MNFNFFKKKAKPELGEGKADQATIDDAKSLKKRLKENTPEAKQEIKDNEARERLKNRFMKLKEKKIFKKKKKFTIRGFARNINLQEYLEKAGLERIDAKQITKRIFHVNVFICIIISIAIIFLGISFKTGLLSLLVMLLLLWLGEIGRAHV